MQDDDDRSDDRTAFERLFHAHYTGLCAFVRGYVREWSIAEEVVQDTFLAIWQRRQALHIPDVSRTYLFTAARNTAVNHLRRRGLAERIGEHTARELMGSTPPADAEAQHHELADAIDAAVDTLPERTRLVFTLRRDGALSNAEIAETLGVTVKAVEANMARAFRLLREQLAPLIDQAGRA